jgi:cytoskeletal protein RodZ
MSVTYPADPAKPYGDRVEAPRADMAQDEPFVPVYARRGKARGGQGKIKTWMILAPVAVLALGGIGAMMVMQGPEEASTPLVEPAATAPVLPIAPTEVAAAPLTSASTSEPVNAAPVVRSTAPLRRAAPAPARREAVRAPAPTATATPRVVTPAPTAPTAPQPYTPAPAAPSAATLNTAPAAPAPATPVPAPTPPVVIVEPVG